MIICTLSQCSNKEASEINFTCDWMKKLPHVVFFQFPKVIVLG